MKKLFTLCLAIGLLSLGVYAQEDQFVINESQGYEDTNSHEHETEAVLMILDKESNLPVCRLSDQVQINSDFIPENRLGNADSVSIEDVRVCEEEDVWNAVEEEMIIGMAVGLSGAIGPEIGVAHRLMSGFVPATAGTLGIFCNAFGENYSFEWNIAFLGIHGTAAIRSAHILITKSGKFPFFNPIIGTLATIVGLAGCASGLGLVEFEK